MLNYWWVTRPKRKLNSVPDVLAVFAEQSLDQVWQGQRESHLSLEDALESSGLKREGDRRDQTGGGARTYKAWLLSLGLIFSQQETNQLRLTLAGEAIMNGASPVHILTNQVLKYQFPSAYSLGRGVQVHERFKIHPFWFLLKLLIDDRLRWLSQEEIAKIVLVEAENESDQSYEQIVKRILLFREMGDRCLSKDFFTLYKPSKGDVNPEHPFSHLEDTANTMINWMEYTQYVFREDGKLRVLEDRYDEVKQIISKRLPFIDRPGDHEFFQRKYGLDPAHRKDTRNLSQTETVTADMIAEYRVKQAFVSLSLKEPIGAINAAVVDKIAELAGISAKFVEEILQKKYPHGSIGAFMANYFELAFNGREDCRKFEIATAEIFKNVFGFTSHHIAGGAKEVPDVLLIAENAGYQAIIDTKAYNRYDLGATQRDRMIYHYLQDIQTYSSSTLPVGFFSYIAGGFSNNIASPLCKIVNATGVNGSAMPVAAFIKMAERQGNSPYTKDEICQIFSVNRKIELSDLDICSSLMVAENSIKYGK
ncbi:AlwI restriction endonuclease [Propionispira arboris]|uniref:AlwI restriction endonuclease n=1 Tax=Propionispira arboris TaxID=84035 RepID=A0A1H6V5X4_9FIRM|nr:AlwI family type II restriction endonuclease [Propionispira arboris]SEJ00039.1 AlwI restriction endonuclease [Propionispira arboris]